MASYENWHVWIDFGAGYVDRTADVDTIVGSATVALGDGKETTGEPGRLRMLLANSDHRYTPGNQTSSLALATGMPVKVTETIGIFEFRLHAGTIEFPELNDWSCAPTDQQILVVSVDQLSRWERSPRFVSTLGAQIQYGSGSSLVGYWPCHEGGETYYDVLGTHPPLYEVTGLTSTGIAATDTETVKDVIPNGAGPVLADDVSVVRLDAALGTSGGNAAVAVAPDMRLTDFTATLAPGQVATLAGWYYPLMPVSRAGAVLLSLGTSTGDFVKVTVTDATGKLAATGSGGAISGSIPALLQPMLYNNAWIPIALRYGYNAGVFELWVGVSAGEVSSYTGSLTGTPGSNVLTSIYAAQAYAGGFGHMQLYIGAATDYTLADFQSQVVVATHALDRQATGDRVRTLGAYGGLTDAQMAGVDTGSSVMSAAELAGQTVAAAMYDARDTEQGRLFMAGSGDLTFHDRRTVLNV